MADPRNNAARADISNISSLTGSHTSGFGVSDSADRPRSVARNSASPSSPPMPKASGSTNRPDLAPRDPSSLPELSRFSDAARADLYNISALADSHSRSLVPSDRPSFGRTPSAVTSVTGQSARINSSPPVSATQESISQTKNELHDQQNLKRDEQSRKFSPSLLSLPGPSQTSQATRPPGPSNRSTSTLAAEPAPASPTALARPPAAEIVEISSDDSSNDESGFLEVTEIRRAPIPAYILEDTRSLRPLLGERAESSVRARGSRLVGSRPIGVSVNPSAGSLQGYARAMRPSSSDIDLDAELGFSVVEAQSSASRPLERSAHPITDQRFKSSNLVRPTMSPPRAKPPPIERPLLSTFTCPICFEPPANACLTPCGHLFCGECLFQTLKTQAIQRGTMEDENSALNFGGMFAAFAPAGTFGSQIDTEAGAQVTNGTRGGGHAARSGVRGRQGGGSTRARNKPDPLAGHCPVCRAKIKGGFSGRDKNGALGLRIMIGKPVNDPRKETAQLKAASEKGFRAEHQGLSLPISLVESIDSLVNSSDIHVDTTTVSSQPSAPQGRKRRRGSSVPSQAANS